MKTIALALFALLCSTSADACPLARALIDRYGISFGGFAVDIPSSDGPYDSSGGSFVSIPLPTGRGLVSDGFRHTLVVDTKRNQAWIYRVGGFAGVREWFGPVDVIDPSLENCPRTSTPRGQTLHMDAEPIEARMMPTTLPEGRAQ